MLAAMTFNVGVFFAVCFGYALGQIFFGHHGKTRYNDELEGNCC
jgi:hypothetical protein